MFSFPMKTFDPDNLLNELLSAKEGTMFLLGENSVQHEEGDNTIELVWVKVIRTKSF